MAELDAMKTFLANIDKALTAAGINWSELSKLTGIVAPDLYRLKAGNRNIRIDRAELIAKSIGYELYEMLNPKFQPKKHAASRRHPTAA
jgi:predicted transcriptional regulator